MNGSNSEEQPNTTGSQPQSPSMSQSQQQGGQARQPAGYPSPTSYPSPGMTNTQYAYPAPGQQANEPYRASPTGSNSSLNLPSMRDALQQPNHQQQMNQPLPPPSGQMGGPYYHGAQTLPHPGMGYPNVTSDPMRQMYALPPTDQRVMSGGRHKKEIKRRTKTGCLTCRKRRIKCDEAQPACRNCQKSKRECLGYDPIFKNPQTGPAAIQPAPSASPSQASTLATANPYGDQAALHAYGQAHNMAYDPALAAGVSSGGAANQFDYASAIDPALEGVASAQPAYQISLPGKVKIDDLLTQGGDLPPTNPETANKIQDSGVLDEVKHLYHSIYSPGLENFLESKWFPSKGVSKLLGETKTLEQFIVLLEQFKKAQDNTDSAAMAYTASVEARVVWALACMVRQPASDGTNGTAKHEQPNFPTADDATEAGNRLTVFENLVTGAVAPNVLTRPVMGSTNDPHKIREHEFWFQLGHFVSLHDQGGTNFSADIDNTMSALRGLLDGRENRDVLYSIVVVRALGPRVAEYTETDKPLHLDESDQRSKLAVAKKFVKDEGQGAGTTNVIRRLCELATRSWETVVPPPPAPAPTS